MHQSDSCALEVWGCLGYSGFLGLGVERLLRVVSGLGFMVVLCSAGFGVGYGFRLIRVEGLNCLGFRV